MSSTNNNAYVSGVAGGDGAPPRQQRPTMKRTLSAIPEPKIRSGLGGVISNLVNSIVGAGIIGIPYAFREAGMVTGLVLLSLVAYMTGTIVRSCSV